MTSRSSVLLTGAGRASSIAHGIARDLAADGWDLALTTWRRYDDTAGYGGGSGDVAELVDDLTAAGAHVHLMDADLSDPEVPARVVREAAAKLGGLDALVLSHAHGADSSILDTTVESFDKHFAVNVRAAWLLIREFARLERASGRIVALTSDHIVHNMPYGASKGALDRIVIAAAGELGHLGITANLVNPGPIDTGWMDDQTRVALTAMQPTGRLGTPHDAAELVRFLLSEQGSWITGQLIKSDGGFSTH
ncbi:SDR family oxidoreductase [Planctomonas sp. JC2975]|uniref:SDR family oxidoreductase n=1 Tax=Planctomonas sp. JC2975 TaxID=2729626 RepID=UPI0014730788|nr:SDR family oxidoreductase [Planctomonas sp. JC2975]NNC13135.1 SDR family oxidoreductase [Planctomonas sp. JC2975]